uniref:CX domain-containing protein n=1 Tax=Angiostrongylus cantonensis TaxID=6313 RepID=A0A0K0D4W3_ANGCA
MKHINHLAIDPSFYDCVYSTPFGRTIIERCYKDFGCCSTKCCSDQDWLVTDHFLQFPLSQKTKYAWALVLIVAFCALVVIAVVIWMIVWLVNRNKDKKQKRLLKDSGMSRANSNVS